MLTTCYEFTKILLRRRNGYQVHFTTVRWFTLAFNSACRALFSRTCTAPDLRTIGWEELGETCITDTRQKGG